MSTTYNFATGKIVRDFKFVRLFEACRRSQLPCRSGSHWCRNCNYFAGHIDVIGKGEIINYIRCRHPDAEDSKGYEIALDYFKEKFELEALEALCQ